MKDAFHGLAPVGGFLPIGQEANPAAGGEREFVCQAVVSALAVDAPTMADLRESAEWALHYRGEPRWPLGCLHLEESCAGAARRRWRRVLRREAPLARGARQRRRNAAAPRPARGSATAGGAGARAGALRGSASRERHEPRLQPCEEARPLPHQAPRSALVLIILLRRWGIGCRGTPIAPSAIGSRRVRPASWRVAIIRSHPGGCQTAKRFRGRSASRAQAVRERASGAAPMVVQKLRRCGSGGTPS